MGVSINSKNYNFDMPYSGFNRFRKMVAMQLGDRFYEHYTKISDIDTFLLSNAERVDYFANYDDTTKSYIQQGIVTADVANFLYQSDCDGTIDSNQAKQVYDLIKNCDDNIQYGYIGRDCTTMADLKAIFADGSVVVWY